ncbi:aminodeoxychorismate synthase component I [Colwelliaceae bacterium 6471]
MSHNSFINLAGKPLTLTGLNSSQTLFALVQDLPWSIWLDSANSKHVDSRYDIIVWQPKATLTTYGNDTDIHWLKNDKKITSQRDPLQLVKEIQADIFANISITGVPYQAIKKNAEMLPFMGGSLGYFSYDLGRRFEVLPEYAEQDISQPEMAVGIYTQAIIFDNNSEQYYLVCPDNERSGIENWLVEQFQNTQKLQHFQLTSAWHSNISEQDYRKKFQQVQDYLLSGDCYQINLAQRFSAHYQGEEFLAYLSLREENKAPFSAFMRFEKGCVLSISPERFLQLKNGSVQSKPIKGTRPRSKDPTIDKANAKVLKHAPKDNAENLMIVDLLRNDISKVCQPGSVIVPKLFEIESFPAVHHLVSTVEGKLDPKFDGTDLLRGAFPGGSITGAPKIRAMEIIEELEPHRRSVYCGSIGYISACGNMDTSITIRTLVCEKNTIYCWAGGGLVADSNVDSEYQETFDKVHHILPVLSKL